VPDHAARVDTRHPADEREEAVPEREGVARMQATVLELVDRAQVQIAESDELADARLVEQAVAEDDALDVPEEPAEHDPDRPDPGARTSFEPRAEPGFELPRAPRNS